MPSSRPQVCTDEDLPYSLDKLLDEENIRLEKISGMTREEAKKILMDNLIKSAKTDASAEIYRIVENAKKEAQIEAKNIIISAMQQTAADHAVESTVSIVSLPSDDMKGRIIGREGRNIRAFEITTGIDVIVDDTPEAVILSGYDPYRRELARITMEKLVSDGRIHPGRIEETYEKTQQEMKEYITDYNTVSKLLKLPVLWQRNLGLMRHWLNVPVFYMILGRV